jgi:2-alkenal reductase
MQRRNPALPIVIGCAALFLLALGALALVTLLPATSLFSDPTRPPAGPTAVVALGATQEAIPTWTVPSAPPTLVPAATVVTPSVEATVAPAGSLPALYQQLNPGVVNIQVFVDAGGQLGRGAGSGLVLDDQGHIVTNNHVIANAELVTVIFFDGQEAIAEVIGADDDSDLAVIRVDALPEGVHPLPLGDSSLVQVGEPVIAIGNPFGLGSSMTTGIVSANGRTIDSQATPFSIPLVIQTDAAINPGNSGGPLLNLRGEVIGVNAQIATNSGVAANAGVGFAIPSSVVRLVAPVLIAEGVYEWPWLGVTGTSVNLALMEANELESQDGAYIDLVVPGGPAEQAGLRGSSGREDVRGLPVPTGGDVILAVDGQPIADFDALLANTAFHHPGDTVTLTVVRDGERVEIPVTLQARPVE